MQHLAAGARLALHAMAPRPNPVYMISVALLAALLAAPASCTHHRQMGADGAAAPHGPHQRLQLYKALYKTALLNGFNGVSTYQKTSHVAKDNVVVTNFVRHWLSEAPNTTALCKLDLALLDAVNKLPYESYMLVANLRNNEALISHWAHQLLTTAVLLPGKVRRARRAAAARRCSRPAQLPRAAYSLARPGHSGPPAAAALAATATRPAPPARQVSVSIYESGSSDDTAHVLEELVTALQALGITSKVVWDGELRREPDEDRIQFLAKVGACWWCVGGVLVVCWWCVGCVAGVWGVLVVCGACWRVVWFGVVWCGVVWGIVRGAGPAGRAAAAPAGRPARPPHLLQRRAAGPAGPELIPPPPPALPPRRCATLRCSRCTTAPCPPTGSSS